MLGTMIKEDFRGWGTVTLSGMLLVSILYIGWATLLDGKVIHPILEMGARPTCQGCTHLTTKAVYHPGDMVYAEVEFHKTRNLVGTIQWHIINKKMEYYPPRPGSLPAGIWDKAVPIEVIPLDAMPGEHWFVGTIVYHPNWLGTVTVPIITNKFEVVRQ